MQLGLQGKRALVTGAGRGLGESMALCLAREGAHVAVVSRTQCDLDSLMQKMGGPEKGHYCLAKDLMPKDAPAEIVKTLHKDFGPIDIVIHNLGGTLDITDPFCSIEDWSKLWRFNMEVALELNLLLVPFMKKKHWGRIIHITSIAATENQGPVPYCSIKAALTCYTRSMGRVLASDGIIMTAVLPGAVFTEGGYWDTASRERPEHVQKYLSERMAIKRFGTPDEIGNAVAFLCSEQASFFVGSVIPIDGGQGRSFFGQGGW
ncbi:MAG: SDR family oxidoreductase [Chlamydiae bacterium]|nr:SDR family oxidoreductase [Chlamydiota bacterium]